MSEAETIAKLLRMDAGFEVSLFGRLLSIRQLESGRFEVSREAHRHADPSTVSLRRTMECEEFAEAGDAAKRFVELRQLHGIGFDHEVE